MASTTLKKLREKYPGMTMEDMRTIRRIWYGMKGRCYDRKNPAYCYYGARGIVMCDDWKHSFYSFASDMGLRPAGMSIDRKDNDGNYEPGNCRWATTDIQANNRRPPGSVKGGWSHDGRTMSVVHWARIIGWESWVLRAFLKKGNTIADAITESQRIAAGLYHRFNSWSIKQKQQHMNRVHETLTERRRIQKATYARAEARKEVRRKEKETEARATTEAEA